MATGLAAAVRWYGRGDEELTVETNAVRGEQHSRALGFRGGDSPGRDAIDAGFLGVRSCMPCHRDYVDSFVGTAHYLTSRVPDGVRPSLQCDAGHNIFKSRNPDLSFEATWSDSGMLISATRRTRGVTQKKTASVDLVFGSGGADEVFHSWDGNQLFQLPVAWISPWNRWCNAPGYLDGTANFRRPVTPRCLECHTTYARHLPGTTNEYVPDSILTGVSCERCHGAGSRHVDHHTAHPDDTDGRHIILPSGLPRERQMDLCNQCHSNTSHRKQSPFSYQPGMPLTDFFRMDLETEPEHGHTANNAFYLEQSACFSDQTMTCTTCHNPHSMEPGTTSNTFGSSCQSCHERKDCGGRSQIPVAIQDQCVDCHMPSQLAINVNVEDDRDEYVPVLRRRNHRIGIYPGASQRVLLAWLREQPDTGSRRKATTVAASLIRTHVLAADDFEKQYRYLAAIGELRRANDIGPSVDVTTSLQRVKSKARSVRLKLREAVAEMENGGVPAAILILEEILQIQPDHAVTLGKLGTALAIEGQMKEAFVRLEAAAAADPDDPYAYSMLAWLSHLDGRQDVAMRYFRLAREITPRNSQLLYNMSFAAEQQAGHQDAIELLREASGISPESLQIQKRLSELQSRSAGE